MNAIAQSPFRNVYVIRNPASGREPLPMEELYAGLDNSCPNWRLLDLDESHSIYDLAKRAVAEGADVVVACGGDGTVGSVAAALMHTGVPLAIVPQGTANVFAAEMKTPTETHAALALINSASSVVRTVDVVRATAGEQERHFLLRLSIGWEAATSVLADKPIKERFGRWAYLVTALQATRELRAVRYRLEIDGQRKIVRGVSCLVTNSGNVGLPGLQVLPEIDVADGVLNVLVVQHANVAAVGLLLLHTLRSLLPQTLLGVSSSSVRERQNYALRSFTGRRVRISASQSQIASCDGEEIEAIWPIEAEIVPGALRVVVPGNAVEPVV